MRDAVEALGGAAGRINPVVPVDLVIDHSVVADVYGRRDALEINTALEFERNLERYRFLRWGQQAFSNMRVVPPGHRNLPPVQPRVPEQRRVHRPPTVPPTPTPSSERTRTRPMVNGLGVLAWGVGGIEAEAAMLGQPISMLVPTVVGLRLTGEMPEGTTATDLVLSVAELLRSHGVVGKFVECYGPGVAKVPLENRATIGNMSPEYGSTVTIFPSMPRRFVTSASRGAQKKDATSSRLTQKSRASGTTKLPSPLTQSGLSSTCRVSKRAWPGPRALRTECHCAAPRRCSQKPSSALCLRPAAARLSGSLPRVQVRLEDGTEFALEHGHVVIAAITSCTNTSNPQVMIGAGLVAKKAVELGISSKPWVKTSLAPGSRVVMDYLGRAGLVPYLDKLGFNLVGFGCTTCIGNSGPLMAEISDAINSRGLACAAVLSGNRNFEGRIHPDVRMNYLASPPLVVAYALAGTMNIDLTSEPLGVTGDGRPVFLADLWPSAHEIAEVLEYAVRADMFRREYSEATAGDENWRSLEVPAGEHYAWDAQSTYVRRPPFLEAMKPEPQPVGDVSGARVLAVLGDSVTTDHISPAGSIRPSSPAGQWLQKRVLPWRSSTPTGPVEAIMR